MNGALQPEQIADATAQFERLKTKGYTPMQMAEKIISGMMIAGSLHAPSRRVSVSDIVAESDAWASFMVGLLLELGWTCPGIEVSSDGE
jgi:hypothetical protein